MGEGAMDTIRRLQHELMQKRIECERLQKALATNAYTANLGCASTAELLEELAARARVLGYANYRTLERRASSADA